MKKTAILIFALASALTVLTACSQSEPVTPSADSILDDQIFTTATGAQDLEKCSEILSSTKKDECKMVVESLNVTDEAVKNVDKSACNAITDERYKDNCINSVEAQLAYQNRAETYQEDIQKQQEENASIQSRATAKKDADICNEMKDDNQKYSCRYNVLADQAIEKKDASICEDIDESIFIEKCKEAVNSL
ncbi:MAG: hypothetical protein ABIH78_00255 [Candidatus Peregrinibacteria bacterium]